MDNNSFRFVCSELVIKFMGNVRDYKDGKNKGGKKMNVIEMTYFKKSGKFYMKDDITIPEKFIEDYKNESISKYETQYKFRAYLYAVARHSEFTVVAIPLEDDLIGELLGFPIMIIPKTIDNN